MYGSAAFELSRQRVVLPLEGEFGRDAEIDQPKGTGIVDQDAARLDILVHDIELVHSSKRVGDGVRNGEEARQW